MKKASKALFTICAIIGFILLMKWWDGPTEFSHLDWGISKETVKYELNLNEKVIVESDNFILSEVEFGMENEKRLVYTNYIFFQEITINFIGAFIFLFQKKKVC